MTANNLYTGLSYPLRMLTTDGHISAYNVDFKMYDDAKLDLPI